MEFCNDKIPDMPQALCNHTAVVLDAKTIMVVGGEVGGDEVESEEVYLL